MSELDILIQLRTQLVNFLDELIETFPQEPDFIIARIFVKDKIPMVDIMEYITTKLSPLQDMVKARNSDFFLKRNVLFEGFSSDEMKKINHFKNIWVSPNIDNDDREAIWSWFETFINLGNKYLKCVSKK